MTTITPAGWPFTARNSSSVRISLLWLVDLTSEVTVGIRGGGLQATDDPVLAPVPDPAPAYHVTGTASPREA